MRDGWPRASFERYVAALPGGLSAYPEARAKGSLFRSFLEEQPASVLAALPGPMLPLVRDPPLDSDWVPEAHFCGLVHALAEARRYSGRELLAWTRARNRALFSSTLYRLLMSVTSPEGTFRNAPTRWGVFHRGSSLAFDGFADDGARVTLTFPKGLFDGLMLAAFAEAFAAALEAARARDPAVRVEEEGPGFARFLGRW